MGMIPIACAVKVNMTSAKGIQPKSSKCGKSGWCVFKQENVAIPDWLNPTIVTQVRNKGFLGACLKITLDEQAATTLLKQEFYEYTAE